MPSDPATLIRAPRVFEIIPGRRAAKAQRAPILRIDTAGQSSKYSAMRDDGILKHLALAMVIAIVFYVAGFSWLEHRRLVGGPWEVTFRTDAAGKPSLLIDQPHLGISETVLFAAGQTQRTNLSRMVRFTQGTTELPFGEMIYQDPTFLPGTVTMRLFGHQIELLPRVLTIDKKPYPWKAGSQIEVPRVELTSPPKV
jgi:hypothetical protein